MNSHLRQEYPSLHQREQSLRSEDQTGRYLFHHSLHTGLQTSSTVLVPSPTRPSHDRESLFLFPGDIDRHLTQQLPSPDRSRFPRAWRPSAPPSIPPHQLPNGHSYINSSSNVQFPYGVSHSFHDRSYDNQVPVDEEVELRALRRAVLETLKIDDVDDQGGFSVRSHSSLEIEKGKQLTERSPPSSQKRLFFSERSVIPEVSASTKDTPGFYYSSPCDDDSRVREYPYEHYLSRPPVSEISGWKRKPPPAIPPPFARLTDFPPRVEAKPPQHEMTRMLLGMIKESKRRSEYQPTPGPSSAYAEPTVPPISSYLNKSIRPRPESARYRSTSINDAAISCPTVSNVRRPAFDIHLADRPYSSTAATDLPERLMPRFTSRLPPVSSTTLRTRPEPVFFPRRPQLCDRGVSQRALVFDADSRIDEENRDSSFTSTHISAQHHPEKNILFQQGIYRDLNVSKLHDLEVQADDHAPESQLRKDHRQACVAQKYPTAFSPPSLQQPYTIPKSSLMQSQGVLDQNASPTSSSSHVRKFDLTFGMNEIATIDEPSTLRGVSCISYGKENTRTTPTEKMSIHNTNETALEQWAFPNLSSALSNAPELTLAVEQFFAQPNIDDICGKWQHLATEASQSLSEPPGLTLSQPIVCGISSPVASDSLQNESVFQLQRPMVQNLAKPKLSVLSRVPLTKEAKVGSSEKTGLLPQRILPRRNWLMSPITPFQIQRIAEGDQSEIRRLTASCSKSPRREKYMSKGERDQVLKSTLVQITKAAGPNARGPIIPSTRQFSKNESNFNLLKFSRIQQGFNLQDAHLESAGRSEGATGIMKKFGQASYATVRQPRSLINFQDVKESIGLVDVSDSEEEFEYSAHNSIEAEVDECKSVNDLPPTVCQLIQLYCAVVTTPEEFRQSLNGTLNETEDEKRKRVRAISRLVELLYSLFLELYDVEWGLPNYPPQRFSDLRQMGIQKDEILIKVFYWLTMLDLLGASNGGENNYGTSHFNKLLKVQQNGGLLFESILKDASKLWNLSQWEDGPPRLSMSIWLINQVDTSPKGRRLLSRFIGVLPWTASVTLASLWLLGSVDRLTPALPEVVKIILTSLENCLDDDADSCHWCNFVCPGDLISDTPTCLFRSRDLEKHQRLHVSQKKSIYQLFQLLRAFST